MSTTRLKDKISSLVGSQLPDFVRSDYTKFVSFVEAYYRFLEQDEQAQEVIQNANSYSDIDRTTNDFVKYFLANYAKDIPESALLNKPLLVKRIKDLYESKGTELSFKLLFRVFFNETVSLEYPYENVLRPSDGVWEQSVSIRVLMTYGSASDLLNRYLKLSKKSRLYSSAILKIKDLGNSLYEIFFDNRSVSPFVDGDIVTVSDANDMIFKGIVKSTLTSYSILSPGLNFKIGQIFTVNVEGAVGSLIQITDVDSNGGINRLKFLEYGYNFTKNVDVNLNHKLSAAFVTQSKSSKTLGFVENLTVFGSQQADDPNRYFLTDYVFDTSPFLGSVITSKSTTTTFPSGSQTLDNDPEIATVQFKIGAIGKYPGNFNTNRGFLSEPSINLQDDRLYQPFAYLTNTELQINKFFDVVKLLIHPAGQKLFNNRAITSSFDVSELINIIAFATIYTELYDKTLVQDFDIFTFYKNLTELLPVTDGSVYSLTKPIDGDIAYSSDASFTAFYCEEGYFSELEIYISKIVEGWFYNLYRQLDDSTLTADYISTSTYKQFEDTPPASDIKYVQDFAESTFFSEDYSKDFVNDFYLSTYKQFEETAALLDNIGIDVKTQLGDNASTLDNLSISTNKQLSDAALAGDYISSLDSYKQLEETASLLDNISIDFRINNTISEVSVTESALGCISNYVDAGFISEFYIGDILVLS